MGKHWHDGEDNEVEESRGRKGRRLRDFRELGAALEGVELPPVPVLASPPRRPSSNPQPASRRSEIPPVVLTVPEMRHLHSAQVTGRVPHNRPNPSALEEFARLDARVQAETRIVASASEVFNAPYSSRGCATAEALAPYSPPPQELYRSAFNEPEKPLVPSRLPKATDSKPVVEPEWATVKWFNPAKGFGFVIADIDKRELFLHSSVVTRAGLSHPQDRSRLLIVRGPGRKPGEQCVTAINVPSPEEIGFAYPGVEC